MAWKITHDLLAKQLDTKSRVNCGRDLEKLKEVPQKDRITFRLLDDDLEHYYTGVADRGAYEDDDDPDGLYGCYQWAMNDSGCTHLLLKLEEVLSFIADPDSPHIRINKDLAFDTGPNKGWVSIYG